MAKGAWIGLNVSYGGHFVAIGKVTSHAMLFDSNDPNRHFIMTGENWNVGPGLGGAYGVQVLLVTNCDDPSYIKTDSGTNLTLGLGANWAKVAQWAKNSKSMSRVARIISTGEKFSSHIPMSLEDVHQMIKNFSFLLSSAPYTNGCAPAFTGLDVPIPDSTLQLSLTWGFTNFRIERVQR